MSENKCEICQQNLVLDEENICAQCELKESNGEDINIVNCSICNDIVESEAVSCDKCSCWYHNDCCENPLIEDLYSLLNEAPNNVKWFCDKCIWETEKWIKSFKGVKGRPKKRKVTGINHKNDVLEDKLNYDHTKEPEVKIEIENEASDCDFEDNQNSDPDFCIPDDYEDIEIPNKKKRCSNSKKSKPRAKRKNEDNQNSDPDFCIPDDCEDIEKPKKKKKNRKKSNVQAIKLFCDLCPRSFLKPDKLIAHKLWHSGDMKPYKCTTCDNSFSTRHYLKLHLSKKHSDDKPFICEICGDGFKGKWALKKHCKEKHSDPPELIKCALCEYSTVNKQYLKSHMHRHSDEKLFVCDVCGKQVKDAATLRQHKLLHTGEKPHKCKICGKQFRASGTLRVHVMYHNKIVKHRCPECGYGSPTLDNLRNHMNTVHSKETPYECDVCGNKYKTKGNLSKHKRGIRGSCQGAKSVNLSKQQKVSDHSHQNKQKQTVTVPQISHQWLNQLQPFSEQSQTKAKDTSQQHYQVQSPDSEMHCIVTTQSHQNPIPLLLYAGVPNMANNNSHYHGGLMTSSSISLQEALL